MDTDWLWQGIAVNLLSDALVLAAVLAWKRREEIASRLGRTPKPVSVMAQATITAGSEVKALANVYSTVGKELNLLWNVQTPTPPLALRMLNEGLEVLSLLPRHL